VTEECRYSLSAQITTISRPKTSLAWAIAFALADPKARREPTTATSRVGGGSESGPASERSIAPGHDVSRPLCFRPFVVGFEYA
jgi:hypothetical protein